MITIVVPGAPVPKPRQAPSDKWRPSPSVVRYRAWCDIARVAARPWMPLPPAPWLVDITIYFPIPESWSEKKRLAARGFPKLTRPDTANVLKAVEDALWPEDAGLWQERVRKIYDDGNGPRVVINITPEATPWTR